MHQGPKLLIAVLILSVAQAAPSIEPCPSDSLQIDGSCKCNPDSCTKPVCPYTLTLSTNGTSIPGQCCPTYTCEGCPPEDLLEGKCPCAPQATLQSNLCKCIDPDKHLVDGQCVCNPDQCSLPPLCDENSVATITETENKCCKTVSCIRCPHDSFKMEGLEEHCVCHICNEIKCGVNETVKVLKKGSNFPGHCCDLYECVGVTKTTCNSLGSVYEEGESWIESDQECQCQNGVAKCAQIKKVKEANADCYIPADKKIYKHGETWNQDDLIPCRCNNGREVCTDHYPSHNETRIFLGCKELSCARTCHLGRKLDKNGCQTCKCNSLKDYNLTLEEFKNLVLHNIKATEAAPTVLAQPPDQLSCQDSFYIIIISTLVFALIMVFFILIFVLLRPCSFDSKRSKQSYEVVDNNNTGTITTYSY